MSNASLHPSTLDSDDSMRPRGSRVPAFKIRPSRRPNFDLASSTADMADCSCVLWKALVWDANV
jgi:hypothetical protein